MATMETVSRDRRAGVRWPAGGRRRAAASSPLPRRRAPAPARPRPASSLLGAAGLVAPSATQAGGAVTGLACPVASGPRLRAGSVPKARLEPCGGAVALLWPSPQTAAASLLRGHYWCWVAPSDTFIILTSISTRRGERCTATRGGPARLSWWFYSEPQNNWCLPSRRCA